MTKFNLQELENLLTLFIAEYEERLAIDSNHKLGRMFLSTDSDSVILNMSNVAGDVTLNLIYTTTKVQAIVKKLTNSEGTLIDNLQEFTDKSSTKDLVPTDGDLGAYYRLIKTRFLKTLLNDKKGNYDNGTN